MRDSRACVRARPGSPSLGMSSGYSSCASSASRSRARSRTRGRSSRSPRVAARSSPSRALAALGPAVALDALILSSDDATESGVAERASSEAELVLLTEGARGGTWRTRAGDEGSWAAVVPPGPIVDTYGCGDAFAAGVTFGLAARLGIDGAIELGARCASVTLAGEGPYGRELSPALLDYPPEPPDDD